MTERFWPAFTALWVGLALMLVPVFGRTLEDSAATWRIQRMQRHRASEDIVLAGVDEATFASKSFNRAIHSQIIENLTRAGVRCIFYDILFDEPREPDVDAKLAAAVNRSGVCVLAGAFKGSQSGDELINPQLISGLQDLVRQRRAYLGFINNSDESTQTEPMLALRREDDSGFYMSAGLAMFAMVEHVLPEQVEIKGNYLAVPPAFLPVTVKDKSLYGTRVQICKLSVVYHPPATGPAGGQPNSFQVIPYHMLKDARNPQLRGLAGKIVIVGENTKTDTDVIQTPVGRIKGFEVHAQILNTLLDGFFPQRSEPGTLLYRVDCCFILLLCTGLAFRLAREPSPARLLLVWSVGVVFALGVHLVLARSGILLHFSALLASLLLTLIFVATLRFEASRRVLRTFIPEVVANQLLATGKVVEGEVEATVIVTDIRGYTTLSESKTPRQILLMLNEYHTETVSIFERFGGHVLNYQGDAQIVIFGYPRRLKDAAGNAIKASLATADAVNRLRDRWGITDKANFDVGCGICTGPVAVGELGAEGIQSEYTVIGETVRRCHKVQSMSTALQGNVLMDEASYKACKRPPVVHEFLNIELEGIAYPVNIYRAESAAEKKGLPV